MSAEAQFGQGDTASHKLENCYFSDIWDACWEIASDTNTVTDRNYNYA
jgi:hypothetical protein